MREFKTRGHLFDNIITRSGKIVWKHKLNWTFYAFMLRTKVYYNSFSFSVHQYVNNPKNRAERAVYVSIILPFYLIIISFFFLPKCKCNRIKLCYNWTQFVKETQISAVSKIERRAKIHTSIVNTNGKIVSKHDLS